MLYNLEQLGDNALTLHFGNSISESVNQYIVSLAAEITAAGWPGVVDVVPAYSSVTIFYNVVAIMQHQQNISATAFIKNKLAGLPGYVSPASVAGKTWQVPVCYGNAMGPDLQIISEFSGLSVHEVIKLHCATVYRIYMIGFLPGFAYMGMVNKLIAVPRKSVPRGRVAAGSVGIAGQQTGIYPFSSPGGWQILGKTPLQLFDAGRNEPVLFKAGDLVQFYPITEYEYNHY